MTVEEKLSEQKYKEWLTHTRHNCKGERHDLHREHYCQKRFGKLYCTSCGAWEGTFEEFKIALLEAGIDIKDGGQLPLPASGPKYVDVNGRFHVFGHFRGMYMEVGDARRCESCSIIKEMGPKVILLKKKVFEFTPEEVADGLIGEYDQLTKKLCDEGKNITITVTWDEEGDYEKEVEGKDGLNNTDAMADHRA